MSILPVPLQENYTVRIGNSDLRVILIIVSAFLMLKVRLSTCLNGTLPYLFLSTKCK